MSQLSLDKATLSDLEVIYDLLRSEGLPIEGVSENIDGFLVVRGENARLIGVAGVEVYGKAALLRSVAVSADRRGEGIGQSLVESCIMEAKKKGVRKVYLLTESAANYMTHFGFRRIERDQIDTALHASEEFKGACADTAVAMLLET